MAQADTTAKASLKNHVAEVYRSNATFVYSDAFTSWVTTALGAKKGEKVVDMGEFTTTY